MAIVFIYCFYLSTATACDINSSLCNSGGAEDLRTLATMEKVECVEEIISEATENISRKSESKKATPKVRLLRRIISFFRRFLKRESRFTKNRDVSTKAHKTIKRNLELEKLNPCFELSTTSITGQKPLKSVHLWSLENRKLNRAPLKNINFNENEKSVKKKQSFEEPTFELTENTKRILSRQRSEFVVRRNGIQGSCLK